MLVTMPKSFSMQRIYGAGLCTAACVLTTLSANAADAPTKPLTLTGHIDVVSAYYLRGATSTYGNVKPGLGNQGADAPESDKPVLQWGADAVHTNGFYAGYWASMINYSYKQLGKSYDYYVGGQALPADYSFQKDKSIENDFYGGYNGTAGDFGYTLGLTGYYYLNGKYANAFETKLSVSYAGVSLTAQTLLGDTVWGNQGDTYYTLNYTYGLPKDISLGVSLGAYTYTKEGKFLGTKDPATGGACPADTAFVVNGCFGGTGPSSGGFRHLILSLSQPIGSTGVTWSVQGIIGGKNRYDIKQGNRLAGSLSYGF